MLHLSTSCTFMRYWTARRDYNQENMSSNENALVYTGSELSSLSCTTVNDILLVFAAGPPPEYNSHQYHHHHHQQYCYNTDHNHRHKYRVCTLIHMACIVRQDVSLQLCYCPCSKCTVVLMKVYKAFKHDVSSQASTSPIHNCYRSVPYIYQ